MKKNPSKWTKVSTSKKNKTTNDASIPNRQNRRSRRKQGSKTLYTRTTPKIPVESAVIGHIFGSMNRQNRVCYKRPNLKKESKTKNEAATTFMENIDFNGKVSKCSSTTRKLDSVKNRIPHKVMTMIPEVVQCDLKFVENKKETYFALVIKGHFPTKAFGDEICKRAHFILNKEIATKVAIVEKKKTRKAKKAQEKALYWSRVPQKKQIMLGSFPALKCLNDMPEIKDEVEDETLPVTFAEAIKPTWPSLPEPDIIFADMLKSIDNRLTVKKEKIVENNCENTASNGSTSLNIAQHEKELDKLKRIEQLEKEIG